MSTPRLDPRGVLLAVYLGTAPVFWFWGIPVEFMRVFKLALAIAAVLSIWFRPILRGKLILPLGLAGPGGLFLLLLTMQFGIFQSEIKDIISQLTDVILGFVFLWTVFLYHRTGGDITRTFSMASKIVVPFCALVVCAGFFGVPNWAAQFGDTLVTLTTGGFSDKRTGWSFGIGLFLPLILMHLDTIPRARVSTRLFYISSAIIVVLSQWVTGGRVGLLASLVGVLIWLVSRVTRWVWVIPLFLGLLFVINNDIAKEHLRLDRLDSGQGFEAIDHFSASRLSRNVLALSHIYERPFLGYGFSELRIADLPRAELVHNVWIKQALQTGILAPTVFGLIVVSLLLTALKIRIGRRQEVAQNKSIGVALLSILVMGVVGSQVEPNVLIGSFQASALWWAAGGAAHALARGSSSMGIELETTESLERPESDSAI